MSAGIGMRKPLGDPATSFAKLTAGMLGADACVLSQQTHDVEHIGMFRANHPVPRRVPVTRIVPKAFFVALICKRRQGKNAANEGLYRASQLHARDNLIGEDRKLYATVSAASVLGCIVEDRLGGTVWHNGHALLINALCHEIFLH